MMAKAMTSQHMVVLANKLAAITPTKIANTANPCFQSSTRAQIAAAIPPNPSTMNNQRKVCRKAAGRSHALTTPLE